jgi:molybdate transport system permease protein
MEFSWQPLILTFKLAILTTIFLIILGIPLAYWLSYRQNKAKYVLQTLVSMPLVLPPTVLGFYLLIAFNPQNFLGRFLESVFSLRLVFSFEGLVVASIIYSFPFMVNPIQAGFQSLSASLTEASYTLGKSRLVTFWKVLLPNIKPSLLTGTVISFAHTVGEFGVILMIGGSIPGETRVASIAIYDEVEALNYHTANVYALVLFAITFTILLSVYILNRRYLKAF